MCPFYTLSLGVFLTFRALFNKLAHRCPRDCVYYCLRDVPECVPNYEMYCSTFGYLTTPRLCGVFASYLVLCSFDCEVLSKGIVKNISTEIIMSSGLFYYILLDF